MIETRKQKSNKLKIFSKVFMIIIGALIVPMV